MLVISSDFSGAAAGFGANEKTERAAAFKTIACTVNMTSRKSVDTSQKDKSITSCQNSTFEYSEYLDIPTFIRRGVELSV